MRQCAIEFEKALAAAVVAIGLGFSSGQARAEDPAQVSAPAPAAIDAGKTQPIVLKAIAVGGLRPGEVMQVTDRGMERVTPDKLARQQLALRTRGLGSDLCVGF